MIHQLRHNLSDYPLEIQEEFLKQVLAEKYRNDLFALARDGLGYQQMTVETHGPICRILMDDSKKKLIVVPRGCFKSSICSISYPIYLLLRDPNERILLDSELFTNSSRLLREVKGHLESSTLVNLYGQFKGDIWNDTEIVISQRTKVYKEGSITCSGVGAQKTGQHYTTIVADDLNSLDNSMSEEQREKIINHYRLYISLLDPGGTLVIVGTRYSQGDLIGYILDNEINPEMKKGLVYK